jgi:hypothetical protein
LQFADLFSVSVVIFFTIPCNGKPRQAVYAYTRVQVYPRRGYTRYTRKNVLFHALQTYYFLGFAIKNPLYRVDQASYAKYPEQHDLRQGQQL